MISNPILQELYEVRDEILAEYSGDVSAYLRDAQQRLIQSGRPIANITQRSILHREIAIPSISACDEPSLPTVVNPVKHG